MYFKIYFLPVTCFKAAFEKEDPFPMQYEYSELSSETENVMQPAVTKGYMAGSFFI